jgi:hypothetical protein
VLLATSSNPKKDPATVEKATTATVAVASPELNAGLIPLCSGKLVNA